MHFRYENIIQLTFSYLFSVENPHEFALSKLELFKATVMQAKDQFSNFKITILADGLFQAQKTPGLLSPVMNGQNRFQKLLLLSRSSLLVHRLFYFTKTFLCQKAFLLLKNHSLLSSVKKRDNCFMSILYL